MSLMRFKADAPLRAGSFDLPEEESRHIAAVYRSKAGDRLVVFDGAGRSADTEVVAVGRSVVTVRTVGPIREVAPHPLAIELWCGLPRAGGAEDLVRRAVEVGATAIRPLLSSRGVWRPDEEREDRRRDRFEKVAVAALKQCGLDWLPRLDAPVALDEIALPAGATTWMGSTRIAAVPLRDAAPRLPRERGTVIVIVGPEGGFTEAEETALAAKGAIPVTAGQAVLRVETACLVLLSHAVSFAR